MSAVRCSNTPALPAAADFKTASERSRLRWCGKKIKVGRRNRSVRQIRTGGNQRHATALVQLLSDFVSTIVFLTIYGSTEV
jgi:hypothetical protein